MTTNNTSVAKTPVQFAYAAQIDTLENATSAIGMSLVKGAASFCEIAYALSEVDRKKLASANGYFKTTADYAEAMFHFKHAQTSNYIKLAKRFLDVDRTAKKISFNRAMVGDNDFSVTQLTETLTLPEDVTKDLIKNGDIVDTMTVREIREVVKAEKARLKAEKGGDAEKADTEAESDIETENANVEAEPETVTFDADEVRADTIASGFNQTVEGIAATIKAIVESDYANEASDFADSNGVTVHNKLCLMIELYNDIVTLCNEHIDSKISLADTIDRI